MDDASQDFDELQDQVYDCMEMAERCGYISHWSVMEVRDFSEHPFPDARRLRYWPPCDPRGEEPVEVPLDATDWAAIWAAADTAIRLSGDHHHVFIDSIDLYPEDDPHVLVLTTGPKT